MSSSEHSWWRSNFAWAALLVVATLAAYFPLTHAGFVWDDDSILTRNPLIKASDGLWRIWFTTDAPDYWPITYTSLWCEWRLWRDSATGYHATNLLLHLLEVFLVWRLLARLKIPGARWGALLFAVHPMNVESVAWIAQRKNLTAMLFLLLSLECFIKADIERPSSGGALFPPGTKRWYLLAFVGFVAAMLGKGSVIILPGILVLLIAYHRRLTWSDALRLAPFAVAAGLLTFVNIWFQFHGSGEVVRHDGFVARLLGAGAALWFYLGKALAPLDLAFVYPRWEIQSADLLWWFPLFAAITLTIGLGQLRSRGARPLLYAWLFFIVALFPALGFADIYFMRYSLVADHYAHVALLGVTAAVAAVWTRWHSGLPPRLVRVSLACAGFVVAVFGVLTFRQSSNYRDSETLWRATLERNPRCWLALTILGNTLTDRGNAPGGLAYQERALRLRPEAFEVQYNFGHTLAALGRPADAMPYFERATALRSTDATAHYALGKAYHTTGDRSGAIAEYHRALVLDPRLGPAHNNLGIALVETGSAAAALSHFERAAKLDPNSAEPHYNAAHTLHASGQLDRAVAEYQAALRLKPDYFEAEHNLGLALATRGAFAEAAEHDRRAIALRPNDANAHAQLGAALLALERTSDAIAEFREAARLNPTDAGAAANLGLALAKNGEHDEAIRQYGAALRLQPKAPDVCCNLASSLLALNRVADATTQLERAVELNPNLAEAHYNLALIARALGKTREATRHYERARTLRPDLPAW